MDVMLQRHCAKYIYVVPDGLKELMSDISREVLRSQPEEIYTFIADYLDALLITRENARIAAKVVESITELARTTAELLVNTGMTRQQADAAATIIQEAFKKHLAEKQALKQNEQVEEANLISEIIDQVAVFPEQAEDAAIIIQTAYRNFKRKREKEKEMLMGMVDWRAAARSAIRLYRKTGVTNEEANRAASLIKAAYKGYYTRRVMKRLVEESQNLYLEEVGEGGSEYEPDYYWDVDQDQRDRQKLVKINYDTVIPHVDFDEAQVIGEDIMTPKVPISPESEDQQAMDSTTIALSIVDTIIDTVTQESRPTEAEEVGDGDKQEAEELTDTTVTVAEGDDTQPTTSPEAEQTETGEATATDITEIKPGETPEVTEESGVPSPGDVTGEETFRTEETTDLSPTTDATAESTSPGYTTEETEG